MKQTKYTWIAIGSLVGISALAYLPLIHKIGYINDDWYLMYDVRVYGPKFFHNIFSSDRPARAFLMELIYWLYGLNPIPYHISAFLLRVLSGLGYFWLCNLMWPKTIVQNFAASLLFMLFPGFLSQINPIDYQSQLFSLTCVLFSIVLTILSIKSRDNIRKWIYMLTSIILIWIYLGLVEYFISFEVLRFGCILVLYNRDRTLKFRLDVRSVFIRSLPFVLSLGGFLVWRLFIFSAERKATDVGLQISSLISSPNTILHWVNYFIQDVYKVLFSIWVMPLEIYVFSLRLRDAYIGFILAGLAAFVAFSSLQILEKRDGYRSGDDDLSNEREKIRLSLLVILTSLSVVIMVNRHVILPDYSRYTLASSAGVALLLVVLIFRMNRRDSNLIVCVLVAIGVIVHFGNSVNAASNTKTIREFWWQVAWRAPDIGSGTTLAVVYPGVAIQEDYFIWGAANHIYRPYPKMEGDHQIEISALVLNEYSISRILAGRGNDTYLKRGDVVVVNDYDSVLVVTQPTNDACVRLLNGDMPELSISDDYRIMVVATHSKLDNVVLSGGMPSLPQEIFGYEPQHDWCYFYQKADLARQAGDWGQVVSLYKEAVDGGYHPNDQIELMPFLQAFTILGDQETVRVLSTRINTSLYYKDQACHSLQQLTDQGYRLSEEMKITISSLFCK